MAINKVVYGNRTLVDMTNATAGADDIVSGKTAYGRSGAMLTGTRSVGGLIRAVYTENVTSGSQYTLQINGYTEGKSLIDAFMNGLRLTDSEFTVTTAGLFRLTNTITGSGNIIQVVHWEQVNGEYVAQDVGSASITFAEASSRNNINSRETVSTIFGKIRKWFSDLKAVAFSGSYNDLTNKPTIPAAVSVKGNAESSYRTGQVNLTPANIGAAPHWSYATSFSNTGTYTIPAGTTIKDLAGVVYGGGRQKTAHTINGFYYSDKYYGTIAVQISASGVLSLYNGWCKVNYNGTAITRADMTAYVYTR